MSDTKFTPGPWIGKRNGRWFGDHDWSMPDHDDCSAMAVPVGLDETGMAVVYVAVADDYLSHEEAIANAHLIAAAPDLYAALEEAVACGMVPKSSATEGGASKYSRIVRCADQIRAALARARGEPRD